MGVVYSLYDALVSINVPDEKARAVIDALERELMDKVATRADLGHLHELLAKDLLAVSTDVTHTREMLQRDFDSLAARVGQDLQGMKGDIGLLATKGDVGLLATKAELAELGRTLTVRLFTTVGGSVALTCTILGTLQILR
jgi:hypothetical protein